MEKNYLTLKWGTLKAWNFEGNEEGIKLLKQYGTIGSSCSAMMQKDTPTQKEIICKLIDVVSGDIYLDWDGKYVSKEDAKKYVMAYGTKKPMNETVRLLSETSIAYKAGVEAKKLKIPLKQSAIKNLRFSTPQYDDFLAGYDSFKG